MRHVGNQGQVGPLETRQIDFLPPSDLETRDDDPPENRDLQQAIQAVEEMRQQWQEHRSQNTEALTRINEFITRLDDLETRLQRPRQDAANRDDELETRAFTNFLRTGGRPQQLAQMDPDEVRALSVTGGADEGATTVPETFLRELIKELTEISMMRQLARITPVSGTPAILPRRTGKPTGAWEGETTDAGETSSTYDQWSIPVHEVRVYTRVSNRLLEDSAFNIEGEIRSDLAEAFEELEGTAFVSGDGTGKPLGFLADTDFVTVAAAASVGEVDIVYEDLVDLYFALKSRHAARGVWVMNRTVMGVVMKLKDQDGRPLWIDSIKEGRPPVLLGKPVFELPDMPNNIADAVPIAFGDWQRAYRILQRMAMTVTPDPFTRAKQSQVDFNARMRVGGKLVLPEAAAGLLLPAAS